MGSVDAFVFSVNLTAAAEVKQQNWTPRSLSVSIVPFFLSLYLFILCYRNLLDRDTFSKSDPSKSPLELQYMLSWTPV